MHADAAVQLLCFSHHKQLYNKVMHADVSAQMLCLAGIPIHDAVIILPLYAP